MAPPASIIVPTRGRPSYLQIALASIAPQASAAGAEVVVVDDAGPTADARALAARFGARYEPHRGPLGLNAARNTGVERSAGELVVFVDDDIRASPGWLGALIEAAGTHPDRDVFTGPVQPRLEGRAPRSCGHDRALITALELGANDTDTRFAWGANMAIRRGALQRVGPFDTSLEHGGDEQEWQERLQLTGGGRARYVALAAVEHRRAGDDARVLALARGSYARGRAARRFDVRRGEAPSRARELRTLIGCTGHVLLRRCPAGLVSLAHSAGRLREALRRGRHNATNIERGADADKTREGAPAGERGAGGTDGDDFLSGSSGTVGGFDSVRRAVRDATDDAWEVASGRRLRLARAARTEPACRRVLVLGVERPEHGRLAARAWRELLRSRHEVEIHTRDAGGRGKFENLNLLLAEHSPHGRDWLLVIDDDVHLPRGFLDRFLFLCERFALQLAQPAHRLNSHAAWQVTRRHAPAVARETAFVEIGPVTAFARVTFGTLLPFPELRMGWGLDMHWAALARAGGWRCGVIDAVAIRHRAAPAARAYAREQAIEEARAFLAQRPHLSAAEAQRTLAIHRRW